MPLFLFLIIILIVIISLFAFPQLSPIPYFPTNKKDLPLIIKVLFNSTDNLPSTFYLPPSTIIDLGAGDGLVIFAAAKEAYEKKLPIKFLAIEINPILVLIMNLRRLFHPNKKNIKILWGDMFKFNFKTFELSNFITFYLYISPWFLEKVAEEITTQISNFKIISYMYKIPRWEKKLIKTLIGENKIFVYQRFKT